MTEYILQKSNQVSFGLRFFVIDEDDNETEITDYIHAMSLWHGEVADRVYGWTLTLTGKYNSSLYVSGYTVRVQRNAIYYNYNNTDYTLAGKSDWYVGKILTLSSAYSWGNEDWELKVVDPLSYISSRVSPVISTSQISVTRSASASSDSNTTAATILGQGEVVGNPVLTPDRAIDGNMSSLWVSAKSPVAEAADPYSGSFMKPHISEVFAWPIPALDKQTHTWIELCLLNQQGFPGESNSYLRLMTKSGIIDFQDKVNFGELYGQWIGGFKPRFLALCYDSGIHQEAWGQSPNHCPLMEWKNITAIWHKPRDYGRVSGRNWGFNLDDAGDYLAVSWNIHPDDFTVAGTQPWGRCDSKWQTMFVEDGPDMHRFDNGATFGMRINDSTIEIHLSSPVAANYYAGCFITAVPSSPADMNCVRYIISHTASSGPLNIIRVTTDPFAWDDINFYPGYSTPISPWPNTNVHGTQQWGGTTGLVSTGDNKSYKLKVYGSFAGNNKWEEDDFPSVGYSGQAQGHETLAWLLLSLDDMAFTVSSPVTFGDTVIQLASTDGLTPTGYVYIDLEGPFQYSSKTATSITFVSPYNGAGAAAGAVVTQCEAGGTSILEWPVNYVSVKRKSVTSSQAGQLRVIKKMYVYGTNSPSPLVPGDETTWNESWTQIASVSNNLTAITNEWNFTETKRYKSYLFVIWEMSDTSQARINEVVLGMPTEVTTSVLESVTISSFFEYVLEDLLGFSSADVDTTGCATAFLGEFATDTVAYMSLISDMCRRTGSIISVSKVGYITVTADPGWDVQPAFTVNSEFNDENTTSISVERIDDRSLSQVQVTAQDYNGNILLGKYPPSPRFFGEPYLEPDLFGVGNADPNQIARYIFSKKTSPVVSCSTPGPALWAEAGTMVTSIAYTETGNELDGNWVISSYDHAISFGSKGVPASWSTNFSLTRIGY